MAYDTMNLETLRRQFHSRSVSFNYFREITNEDMEAIKTIIAAKKKYFEAKTSENNNSGLTNYINTLRYLTNPTISQELKTFDERILYLILSCDPELETFKAFISSEIIPASHIDDEENERKRKELETKRNQELNSFATKVRSKIGFYDPSILKYESILSRKLIKRPGFESDVKKPSLDTLLKRTNMVENINIINDQNLFRLRAIARHWLKEAKDPRDLNSLAYNLLYRFNDLHLYTVEEQIIVFMLIADPDLDLLKIYEEESNFKQVQQRALQELGFYNKGLIKVEQLYHDKFEPDKKLSSWTI